MFKGSVMYISVPFKLLNKNMPMLASAIRMFFINPLTKKSLKILFLNKIGSYLVIFPCA